jgi:hypothetical protein
MGAHTVPFPDDPTYDEFVFLLCQRLGDADVVLPSELHSFKDLMDDLSPAIPETWYRDAYNELDGQGHLSRNSTLGNGGDALGQLSADGMLYWHTDR